MDGNDCIHDARYRLVIKDVVTRHPNKKLIGKDPRAVVVVDDNLRFSADDDFDEIVDF